MSKDKKSLSQLKTLFLMQMKDKVDFSCFNDSKNTRRTIVWGIIKFCIVMALTFGAYFLFSFLGIFRYNEAPSIITIVLCFSLVLSIISCSFELMKTLYFSNDNKVLITLPVETNHIFVSKIGVFLVYEFKKSLSFLVPILLASVIYLISLKKCEFVVFAWIWLPLIFIVPLPVFLGSLISIPLLYIYRFIKKHTVFEVILWIIVLGLAIWGIVSLINIIPDSGVNLIRDWPSISYKINQFLINISKYLPLSTQLVRIIIGEPNPIKINDPLQLELITFAKFFLLVLVDLVLILLSYLLSRPLFFHMMSKNFEIDKNENNLKTNKKANRYATFVKKEFLINIRSVDISINYLLVYIIIPILILLLNKLYSAMNTKILGDCLIYAFNILLIALPLLASNSLVATYYSREGRAGYMKKTKPISALYPLFAKLFFNMLFSIPSIVVTAIIVGKFNSFIPFDVFILSQCIIILHYGHMIFSAMLDIMNPQNEQYEMIGSEESNPNERKSTIYAFIISFVYALLSYKVLYESITYHKNTLTYGLSKLLGVSILYFVGCLILFIKRVKAYYYDMQGR